MVVRAKVAGIDSPEALAHALTRAFYLADDGLATAAYLALALGKPLLPEGAPGVWRNLADADRRGVRQDPPSVMHSARP